MMPLRNYGDGAGEVVVLIVVLVSVLVAGAGDSFTIVVLFSVLFSAGGLVTLVSFFSHAAKSTATARRQMYFFIYVYGSKMPTTQL